MILMVTGTDTGVGKTVATAALAAALDAAGMRTAVYKPVQTGEPAAGHGAEHPGGDIGEVTRLAGPGIVVAEGARLAEPMAPVAAAAAEGAGLPTLAEHAGRVAELGGTNDVVLVEGAGGVLVELTAAGETIADLALAAGGAMLVVARAGLGTLNHTLLTLEAVGARGVPVAGVLIGAWPAVPTAVELSNEEFLRDACLKRGIEWWGKLPAGSAGLSPAKFRARAASLLGRAAVVYSNGADS